MALKDLLRNFDRDVFREPMRDYFSLLERELADCRSLLDIGCGASSPLEELDRLPPRRTGVELHRPTAEAARNRGFYQEVLETPASAITSTFGRGSYDVVTALDVIEHLERPDGERLLGAMEHVASRKVIVFTPNGFVPQDDPSNPWLTHLSGWTVGDFRSRGYEVFGVHGLRRLCGEGSLPRLRPEGLGYRALRA